VTSGANQTAGVPARATVEVRGREDFSQISAPAHRKYRSARLSHPTDEKLTTSKRHRRNQKQTHAKKRRRKGSQPIVAFSRLCVRFESARMPDDGRVQASHWPFSSTQQPRFAVAVYASATNKTFGTIGPGAPPQALARSSPLELSSSACRLLDNAAAITTAVVPTQMFAALDRRH
jgi:hypothetical protein